MSLERGSSWWDGCRFVSPARPHRSWRSPRSFWGRRCSIILGPTVHGGCAAFTRARFWRLLLWWLTTTLFAWYVRNIANYNVLYGSVGAVIALLVWMYLLSIIALFGCEFNAQLDRIESAAGKAR